MCRTEKKRRLLLKERRTPTSPSSSKQATTTRIKTNAKTKMVTQGWSPIREEDSKASEEGVEDTAFARSACKKCLIGHVTFTQQVMGVQQTTPRHNATNISSGEKKANITEEIPTKEALVRLIMQTLSRTVLATPGKKGNITQ